MSGSESVLVIGAGAAGRSAAKSLAASGYNVSVVERDRVGGTCLWRGCIPKKALYTAARAVRDARRAAQFGVDAGELTVDWPEVLAWKWHAQESFAGDQTALLEARGIRIVKGSARFVSAHEVLVGDETLSADHIIIATGSVPVIPQVPGAEKADTSVDALRYPAPPRSLAIVGGGFIAMELAAVYASFGTRVDVIVRGPRVLPMLDPALADVATARLDRPGRPLPHRLGHHRHHRRRGRACREPHPARTPTTCDSSASACCSPSDGALRSTTWTWLPPRSRLDDHGRLVLDDALHTTNPRVWACGDAAGGMMQTPVASLQGMTVARSIETDTRQVPDLCAVPVACFTTPQLATVGLTADEAEKQGHRGIGAPDRLGQHRRRNRRRRARLLRSAGHRRGRRGGARRADRGTHGRRQHLWPSQSPSRPA